MSSNAVQTKSFVADRFRNTGVAGKPYTGHKVQQRRVYDEETGTYRTVVRAGSQCDCACECPGDF